jgi:GR25 family glycosyltransferase involved in LPS biosynthesis
MHVIYINLDQAIERRRHTEENFACYAKGWTLHRQPAFDKAGSDPAKYGDKISKGLIALAISHVAAVEKSLSLPGPVMIAEDDILFGPSSQAAINKALADLGNEEWDLLFTDVCVPSPITMLDLLLKKKKLAASSLIDLGNMVFAGTTGLIINERSKEKYLGLLKAGDLFSLPIDILIRKHAHKGSLRVFSIFPFATSLSKYAEDSAIQGADTEITNLLWNCFRKAIWIDGNAEQAAETLARVPSSFYDPDTLVVCQVIAGLLSKISAKR